MALYTILNNIVRKTNIVFQSWSSLTVQTPRNKKILRKRKEGFEPL